MKKAVIAFTSSLSLSLIAVTLAPTCGLASGAGVFKDDPYFGALSASHADRAVFGRLTKRFNEQPYRIVRRKMIMLGYRPVRFGRVAEEDEQCPYDWARGAYSEVIVCTDGLTAQAFSFRRPRQAGYAVVIAYGETGLKVTNIRAATTDDLREIKKKQKFAANYKPPFPVPFLVVPPCPPELCWNAGKD